MSHRNNASSIALTDRFAPVVGRIDAGLAAILVLVLVLLISNGGAG